MTDLSRRWLFLVLACGWVGLVFYLWSPRHYWPDADGYLLHVAEGRWVAHPPGYPFFVLIGRGFHALGFSPYLSVQLASLALTVAGLFVLHLLLRTLLQPDRVLALTTTAAFSWVVLLNVQTGTSHAADLFTVSLLLLAAVRLPCCSGPARGRDLFFAAALFLCAGFRLTTLIMMAPLCVLVAWHNRLRFSFWVSCLAASIMVIILQSWVIAQSGGYAAYSQASAAMNADNRPSSVILSGLTQTTALNMFRAFLWACIGTLPFLVVLAAKSRALVPASSCRPLAYGLAAMIAPLLSVALYLCTHPGYVVSIVPGAALAAAALVSGSSTSFPWKKFTAAAVGSLALFLMMSPIIPPANKLQAIADGVLLQYSASCSRAAVFNTTARWLRLGGLDSEIPANRVIDLKQEDEWREYFKKVDPSKAHQDQQ